jgi:hypothetical protein
MHARGPEKGTPALQPWHTPSRNERLCPQTPNQVGGYWASGHPYLDAAHKAGDAPEEAGLQLPLFFADVAGLKVPGP